jgi:hypothetical protein
VTGVGLQKGSDGQVLRGGDRSRAFVVFSFKRTSADGRAEERVRRLECQTLAPEEPVLLIQQDMALEGHEEQMQALEDLLSGLVLPTASSAPVDIPNPTTAEPAAIAGVDSATPPGSPHALPALPTPRVTVWSQEP